MPGEPENVFGSYNLGGNCEDTIAGGTQSQLRAERTCQILCLHKIIRSKYPRRNNNDGYILKEPFYGLGIFCGLGKSQDTIAVHYPHAFRNNRSQLPCIIFSTSVEL